MLTIDQIVAAAPPEVCFRVAADVEGRPDILSHYRWVRFHRKDGFASEVVEMAAWPRFGRLGYPTWWVSEMAHDAGRHTVTYRHMDGITRGMNVLWEIVPEGEIHIRLRITHEWSGPPWPLVGGFAAERVMGPHFIQYIGRHTLAGVAAEAVRRAERE